MNELQTMLNNSVVGLIYNTGYQSDIDISFHTNADSGIG